MQVQPSSALSECERVWVALGRHVCFFLCQIHLVVKTMAARGQFTLDM